MKGFSLKEVCRDLVTDLQTSISQKSRIKLSIDIQLPDVVGGSSEKITSTVTQLSKWLDSRLINGVIQIDIVKRSKFSDDLVVAVNVTGLGIKEINDPDISGSAVQFAATLETEIRVKTEEGRITFEFSVDLKIFEPRIYQPPTFLNKWILIAEDSEINALVFAGFMEEWGCEITTVSNGKEAVLQSSLHAFDIIFMDIHMPIMGGNQAIHEIRQVNKEIPIIALTASTLESDIRESLQNGANDYLLKPVASKTLFSMLQKYLAPGRNTEYFPLSL